MADDRPILFFDSGVGGLSIVAPARAAVPRARFVYVADSAGFPYGVKAESDITVRVPALLGRLAERFNPRLIVIACNTASTIALPAVRSALDVPVVGTVPAIRPATAISRTRTIGVLGTEATVRQTYVDDLAARFASDCTMLRHGSAALVEMAEAKLRGDDPAPGAVADAIAPLLGSPALDVLVLACTHFPLLAPELAALLGPGVTLVDGGDGIARRIAALTQGQDWPGDDASDVAVFTRLGEREAALAPALARHGFNALQPL